MNKKPDLSRYRNIGIAAHVDAGKTTLTERMLFYAGVSHKMGEVHDGMAHMDYLAEEQAHGITIMSAVTQVPWGDHTIQLIDTPGHVDFTIEVERSMRVLDGCVIVIDGVRGVEPQTETVWRQRTRANLPTLFFINKMDRPGADFTRAMSTIGERLRGEPVAVTVPVVDAGAVVHLIEGTLITFSGEQGEQVRARPCPESLWEQLSSLRETTLLAIAESDEELAEQVLSGSAPEPDRAWSALRQATLSGRVHPCFGGTALRNQGVQPLMDAIAHLLPSPLDRPPAIARTPAGEEVLVETGPDGCLTALAFKVQMWEGRRHVFARIYRGTLHAGDTIVLPRPDGSMEQERVARLFEVDAHKKSRLDSASAGQIVLLAGLRRATTGDSLCCPDDPVMLERIETLEPVLGLAIEPVSQQDEPKLLEALDKLQQEDPTLRLVEDAETGQRVLRGMGELHLAITFERLQREFHLRVRAGQPDVVLRETVTRAAAGDLLYHRVFEREGKELELKAGASVQVSPRTRGSGCRFVAEPEVVPAGAELAPTQQEAVASAVRDALQAGIGHGAPLEDVSIGVTGIQLFGSASTPQALYQAVAGALKAALEDAGPVLLRPMMALEVVVPEENLGAVLGDLQARQADVLNSSSLGDTVAILCHCALDRVLGYSTTLRSLTHGRGQFSMQFDRFDTG